MNYPAGEFLIKIQLSQVVQLWKTQLQHELKRGSFDSKRRLGIGQTRVGQSAARVFVVGLLEILDILFLALLLLLDPQTTCPSNKADRPQDLSRTTSPIVFFFGSQPYPRIPRNRGRLTGKLGRLWFRYFVEEIFGYCTEWTERDEKHQMFISLQLSDSRRGGAP